MNRLMTLLCLGLIAGVFAAGALAFAGFANMAGISLTESFRELAPAFLAVVAYLALSSALTRYRERRTLVDRLNA